MKMTDRNMTAYHVVVTEIFYIGKVRVYCEDIYP